VYYCFTGGKLNMSAKLRHKIKKTEGEEENEQEEE
jgi:hypothetical protein